MRFVFFGGKGGVGKTTCAAAAAVRAASEGQRVLVVSTDHAPSLGDAFDLELSFGPRRIRDAPGELWAAEIKGWHDLPRLSEKDYDQIVVDAAPDRETLRLLDFPNVPASVTWITLPEELPVHEAEDGVRQLEADGVSVDVIVVNRVWPSPDRVCPLCSPRVQEELRWKLEIERLFAGKTMLEAPAQIVEPRGADELLSLARAVHALDLGELALQSKRGRVTLEDMATIATGPSALTPIASTVRLVLVGGKGGVGKTTISASSALSLASERPNERILLLSTDPAHSLGHAFGLTFSNEAKRIAKGPKNLQVRELDAPDSREELATIAAGLEAYDLVVVDTAPTGRTLRLLEAADPSLVATLSDPVQCAFIVVSRPAALPRLETERLAGDLRRLKVSIAAIVANAVTNPTCSRCVVSANEEKGELDRLERLAFRAARSPRLIVTPAVYPGPHGVRELRLFRDEWTERAARA